MSLPSPQRAHYLGALHRLEGKGPPVAGTRAIWTADCAPCGQVEAGAGPAGADSVEETFGRKAMDCDDVHYEHCCLLAAVSAIESAAGLLCWPRLPCLIPGPILDRVDPAA